jgi:uncharacterized membrane protein YjjB (DUF3815 family)
MDAAAIALHALWSGLFSAFIAVTFTAPVRYLGPAFVCGAVGRGVLDVLVAQGMSVNWATVIAAAAVVVVGVGGIQRREVAPVVLVSSVLPLGAAVAMFNLIFALMQISAAKDEAPAAALALAVNAGKVFTTTLAIAVGLAAGLAMERLIRRPRV